MTTGLVMAALIVGIVASMYFAVEAERLAAEADRQRDTLEQANQQLSEAFLREAIAEAMAGNHGGMEERIAQLPRTFRTWGTM